MMLVSATSVSTWLAIRATRAEAQATQTAAERADGARSSSEPRCCLQHDRGANREDWGTR